MLCMLLVQAWHMYQEQPLSTSVTLKLNNLFHKVRVVCVFWKENFIPVAFLVVTPLKGLGLCLLHPVRKLNSLISLIKFFLPCDLLRSIKDEHKKKSIATQKKFQICLPFTEKFMFKLSLNWLWFLSNK